jgi:hypothetical protein
LLNKRKNLKVLMDSTQKPRKYQVIWNKLVAAPEKPLRVRVTKGTLVTRTRKGVWKEKDISTEVELVEGRKILVRKRYRLLCEVDKDGITLVFRLVLAHKIGNV